MDCALHDGAPGHVSRDDVLVSQCDGAGSLYPSVLGEPGIPSLKRKMCVCTVSVAPSFPGSRMVY